MLTYRTLRPRTWATWGSTEGGVGVIVGLAANGSLVLATVARTAAVRAQTRGSQSDVATRLRVIVRRFTTRLSACPGLKRVVGATLYPDPATLPKTVHQIEDGV